MPDFENAKQLSYAALGNIATEYMRTGSIEIRVLVKDGSSEAGWGHVQIGVKSGIDEFVFGSSPSNPIGISLDDLKEALDDLKGAVGGVPGGFTIEPEEPGARESKFILRGEAADRVLDGLFDAVDSVNTYDVLTNSCVSVVRGIVIQGGIDITTLSDFAGVNGAVGLYFTAPTGDYDGFVGTMHGFDDQASGNAETQDTTHILRSNGTEAVALYTEDAISSLTVINSDSSSSSRYFGGSAIAEALNDPSTGTAMSAAVAGLNLDGAEELTFDRLPDGAFSGVQVSGGIADSERIITPDGTAVTRTRNTAVPETDPNAWNPTVVRDTWGNEIAGGEIGSILGSSIGNAIAGGNVFGRIAASSVLGALLQNVGQTFGYMLDHDVSLGQAATTTFANFDVELAQQIHSAGLGAISSFLSAELAESLGIHSTDFGGQLFNYAASTGINTILDYAIGNVAKGLGFNDELSGAARARGYPPLAHSDQGRSPWTRDLGRRERPALRQKGGFAKGPRAQARRGDMPFAGGCGRQSLPRCGAAANDNGAWICLMVAV